MKSIKIRERKTELSLLAVVMFQIFLLVNMSPATSYVIGMSSQPDSSSIIIKRDKGKDSLGNLIAAGASLLVGFLSIKQIGIVSAEEESWKCCPVTKSGAICQDVGFFDTESCDNPLPTKCDEVADCKIGCCIDEDEGLCTTKSTRKKCESGGGIWKNEESCLVSECQKGCCVLGDNAQFVTEKRCEKLSSFYGFKKDFRDLETEFECLALSASQFEGACILEGGRCEFTTESRCLSIQGDFYKDHLCSNPEFKEMGVECERQASISCIEGKDEIYWIDSCGNRENIYSSDRDFSWNNGKVLSKQESCNPDSDNIQSEECGNCNYFLGSMCAPSDEAGGKKAKDGDYICKNKNCPASPETGGKERKNGESWCAYDSYIGEGKDPAGSRHWRKICIDGEVKTEGCSDYRGGLCTESEIEENGKSFSVASCVVNEATKCLDYNSQGNMAEKCNKNKHCMIKNINIDDGFSFDVCVGRYPRGFRQRESSIADSICAMANQKCTVIYQKNSRGKWECIENCNCEKGVFAEQMNDLCISLGDCGSYINYIGEGSDNIKVTRSPSVSWERYKDYADPVEGQYVKPQEIDDYISSISGNSGKKPKEDKIQAVIKQLGEVSGGAGTLIMAISHLGIGTTTYTYGAYETTTSLLGTKTIFAGSEAVVSTTYTSIGAFAWAAAGFAIGTVAGAFIAQSLGRSGNAATVLTVAGGVAGGILGLMKVGWLKWGLNFGTYALAAAVIIMVYVIVVGWGKTKERVVEFTCMPWQAPAGGENCKRCNELAEKGMPCTRYRCESLGQACRILNEETENPVCESIPYESNPPVISAGDIDEGYKFNNEDAKRVEIRRENGNCIPEFTPVSFSLKTDEFAQCKFDFQKTEYDEMRGYPVEQNAFTLNHTFSFSMPSLDSLSVYDVAGDIREMFGNMNMYVKCKDYHGNYNIDEYTVNFCINSGPDTTAVDHSRTVAVPEDESFLKYNVTETPLQIYLSEPAECRYSTESGKSYEEMSNSMDCKTGITERELLGWQCSTTLKGLAEGENNFYIRCKDQPWLPPENTSRNVNEEDFVYTLYVSETNLNITSITPQGKIKRWFEPISVDLEVETSGGARNGKSSCYYSFSGYDDMTLFFESFSRRHKQNFNTMMKGDYNIYVKCEDDAGNTAYGNAVFTLELDTEAPKIVRAYSEGELKVITDEDAKCYYSFNGCGFDIRGEDAKPMTDVFSRTHTSEWESGKRHYIKCEDLGGNTNPGCAIILRPESI